MALSSEELEVILSIRDMASQNLQNFQKQTDEAKSKWSEFASVVGSAAVLYGAANAIKSIFNAGMDEIQMLQQLEVRTKLHGETLNETYEAAKRLAYVMQIDEGQAIHAVTLAINGNDRALKQYGMTVADSNDKNERAVSIIEQVNTAYQNFNATGIQSLQHGYKELTEQVGVHFVKGLESAIYLMNTHLPVVKEYYNYIMGISGQKESREGAASASMQNNQIEINRLNKEILELEEKIIERQLIFKNANVDKERAEIREKEARAIELAAQNLKLKNAATVEEITLEMQREKAQTEAELASKTIKETKDKKTKDQSDIDELSAHEEKITNIKQANADKRAEIARLEVQAEQAKRLAIVNEYKMWGDQLVGMVGLLVKNRKDMAKVEMLWEIAKAAMSFAAYDYKAAGLHLIAAAKFGIIASMPAPSLSGGTSVQSEYGGYDQRNSTQGKGTTTVQVTINALDADSVNKSRDDLARALLGPISKAINDNGGQLGDYSMSAAT